MNNTNAMQYFSQMASQENISPTDVKIQANNDFSALDADFILQYTTKKSTLLDIGSGTGLTVNKLYPYVHSITAVEPFTQFTQFIAHNANITIVHENMFTFTTTQHFDIITLFGVMHYVNKEEAQSIYARLYSMLKPQGKIIIKQQFGVSEDVTITGFSEELQQQYYSQYRLIHSECFLLEEIGYNNITIHDIYPKECNRWDNTHFYAIVAQK